MTSASEVGDVVLPRAPVRLRDQERDASAAMNDMFDLDAPDQVRLATRSRRAHQQSSFSFYICGRTADLGRRKSCCFLRLRENF